MSPKNHHVSTSTTKKEPRTIICNETCSLETVSVERLWTVYFLRSSSSLWTVTLLPSWNFFQPPCQSPTCRQSVVGSFVFFLLSVWYIFQTQTSAKPCGALDTSFVKTCLAIEISFSRCMLITPVHICVVIAVSKAHGKPDRYNLLLKVECDWQSW